jgi:carbon starvation protein
MVILSIYTIFAAGVPVWIVLQPRDFVNSFLLYGGISFMLIGIFVAALNGSVIALPSESISFGNEHLGLIWPILFITVACGQLVASTPLLRGEPTSKQISKEQPDAKIVGYGGMMLEALLAVGVIFLSVSD